MNIKKYPEYAGYLLFGLIGLLTLGLGYPATIRNIEALNPLLGAGDFLSESLRYPGGMLSIAVTWLKQWFVFPWGGAAIIATLMTLCSLCIGKILKERQVRTAAIWGIILSGIMLVAEFPNVLHLIQGGIGLGIYLLYVLLKKRNRGQWMTLACIMLYPVLGTETVMSLFLAMVLTDLTDSLKTRSWALNAGGLALTAFFPYLWSTQFCFLNEEQREWCQFTHFHVVCLVALPVLAALSKWKGKAIVDRWLNQKAEWAVMLMATLLIPAFYLIKKDKISLHEDFYAMEQAAERGEWEVVKTLANAQRPSYTSLHLRYALLAESELGTLADNLFFYPVTSTTDLYFWRNNDEEPSFFNGLFYKNIGVADEYMHQIFEMGVQSHASMSARTIRHLTEAALMQEDRILARKYLDIAKESQKDLDWTRRTVRLLEELEAGTASRDTIPERSAFFIGSYKPKTEFAYIALDDTTNIKRINLMLCSFLLEKDLDRFRQGLSMYHKAFQNRLPNAYTEACLLISMADRNYVPPIKVSDEKMQEWISYLQLLNQNRTNELSQQYMNTYWYYYLYAKVKELK